ncbi:MAG: penicillin-binding transpeptidase domain-containing protein [Oscillospiraceae bacterium]
MKTKSLRIRMIAFVSIIVFVFSIFFADLFRIQIVHSEEYSTKKVALSTDETTIKAARGNILDRNGTSLVTNRQINSVIFNASYFPPLKEQEKRNEVIITLIKLFEENGAEWNDDLPLDFDSNGNAVFKENDEADIALLKSKSILLLNEYATAENCLSGLIEKFKLENYSRADAKKIASVCFSLKKVAFSAENPFTFAEDVTSELAAKIKENSSVFIGVDIRITTDRQYLDGTIAPHIVGVTGKLSQQEYLSKKDAYTKDSANEKLTAAQKSEIDLRAYAMDDKIGKFGIESAMEQYLRGTNGVLSTTTDLDNNKSSEITTKPIQGDTVILTIDAPFQKAVQEALSNFIATYKSKVAVPTVGSAVVIDVKTGAILACATYPSYDLNYYYKDFETLSNDKLAPLWNRALKSTYAPGSTMKGAMAMAGLEEGIITETSNFTCHRVYTQFKDQPFSCLGYHGNIDVKTALDKSCNIFFYETGRLLGINKMNEYSRKFGLGEKTGVELDESKGVLASIDYRERHGGQWYPGDTVQAAIGQSDNLFTPVQLASYAMTLANNGTRYKAHFVKSVKSSDYSKTILNNDAVILNETGFSKKNFDIVREGMTRVGARTAQFKQFPFPIAAKTGTAQAKTRVNGALVETINGFMISYAPANDPQIAVALAVENITGGSVANALMADIYKAYFNVTGDINHGQEYNTILN